MTDKLNILELYAGMQCFSNVAKKLNCNTFTSDISPLPGIDYVCDILDFDCKKVPFIPDIIWASPDCSTWSKAAGNIHFESKSLLPKTEKATLGFLLIEKTLKIIEYFLEQNPAIKFYIENPVGKLQYFMQAGTLFGKVPRKITIDQCKYGREFKKPTHIFINDMKWKPKERCKGSQFCHHKPLRDGTSGFIKKGKNNSYYKRAEIPEELCREIIIRNLIHNIPQEVFINFNCTTGAT